MPKVKNVEKTIWDVEGFEVHFHQNGRDVHALRPNIPRYPYTKMAKHTMTVNDWKEGRFNQSYPGYDAIIFDGNGTEVTAGQTQLASLRDTYSEDDND